MAIYLAFANGIGLDIAVDISYCTILDSFVCTHWYGYIRWYVILYHTCFLRMYLHEIGGCYLITLIIPKI